MKERRYSLPAILLHWLMAGLIVWLLWLGWSMTGLPKGAERSAAYGLHKSLGLLVLILFTLRLIVRWRCPPPAPAGSGWSVALAGWVHRLLYAFMLLAPLAGYLASSFTPYALRFFGIEIAKAGWPDENLNETFKWLHRSLIWGGAMLIALHLGGVVRHVLQAGDHSVRAMLPAGLLRK